MRTEKARGWGWLLAAVTLSCAPHRSDLPLPTEGLPYLALPAVGRTPFDPGALSGKVVLIQFFATWCFTCLTDLPNLEALQKRHGEGGFQAVWVGMDLEGKRVLEPFAYKFALPFPVLIANEALIHGESRFGRIAALPSSFLFDRNGKLAAAWEGIAPPTAVEERVAGLLH